MKFLFIFLIGLFMIGLVSAANFDNKLVYSENDMKVELENWFGLGEKLGSVELVSHKSIDEVKPVDIGYDVAVMWYDFDFKEDYTNGLGDVKFIDMKTGEEVTDKNYHFAYWGTKEVEDYKWDCETAKYPNGTIYVTNECTKIITTTHEEEGWITLNSKNIPSGKTRIALITDMPPDQWFDAIWTIGGREVNKHAQFSSWLTSRIVSCWTLDGSSPLDFGLGQQFNGTKQGSIVTGVPSQTSSLGSAYFIPSGSRLAFQYNSSLNFTSNFSFALILNTTAAAGNQLGGKAKAATDEGYFLGPQPYWSVDQAGGTPAAVTGSTPINTGNNVLLIGVYRAGQNVEIYANGTSLGSSSANIQASALPFGAPLFIGGISDGNFSSDIYVSEAWMLNYSVNATDAANIFNSGNIISCGAEGTAPTWSNNMTNNTRANRPTLHSVMWMDNIQLSGYIFSFNNGNGTFLNDTFVSFTGTANWSNVTKISNATSGTTVQWKVYANDTSNNLNVTDTFSYVVNDAPIINVFSPTNTTYITPNIFFNATADTSVGAWIVNFNGTNITLSSINTTLPVANGNYSLLFYANNSGTGEFGLNNTIYFSVASSSVNSANYNPFTFETKNETFYINVTTNGSAISSAKFIHNTTTYGATATNIGGDNYNITATIQIPLNVTNSSWHFNYTLAGTEFADSNRQQNVALTNWVHCNATYTTQFLNFSFQDETNSSTLSGFIPNADFTYWLGNGTINKTLNYINNSAGINQSFCFTPVNQTVYVNQRIQYEASGYPQRIYDPDVLAYNNVTNNTILYLLLGATGQTVTFQVVDAAEQVVSGVAVNITRSISGGTLFLSGTTDSAGAVSFFLNPNFVHTISAFKTGYDIAVLSITPTETQYTITLGSQANTTTFNYDQGINYSISPTNTTLFNDTVYNFTFTLSSSYWTVTQWGFDLVNSSGGRLAAANSTSNGGVVYVTYNTTNLSEISMNYFWLINNTYSNRTFVWVVIDSGGTGNSIFHFFTDLKAYATAGLFGIDNFGLALLSFLLIFVGTGIMAYQFGFVSPATIAGTMFFLTLFLNIGVDIIPDTLGVPWLPTIIMGVIFIGMMFWEGSK